MSEIISRSAVKEHLVEMGYRADALPDNILDDFVTELKDLYTNGHFEDKHIQKDEQEFSSSKSKYVYANSGAEQQRIRKNLRFQPTSKGNLIREEAEVMIPSMSLRDEEEPVEASISQYEHYEADSLPRQNEEDLNDLTDDDWQSNYWKHDKDTNFVDDEVLARLGHLDLKSLRETVANQINATIDHGFYSPEPVFYSDLVCQIRFWV
jgi:hypothetical protein